MIPPEAMVRQLLPLLLVLFVDVLGLGIVIPVLPYYAESLQADGWVLGLLFASFSAAQFVTAPLWGRLSDRVGRKPVLLLSMGGVAISLVLLGLARDLEGLFVARILGGIFGGVIGTAYAYVTDITDESNRGKGMGLMGAGIGLAFTVGPLIGGILSRISLTSVMFTAAGIAAANLLLVTFLLKEPPRTRKKSRFTWRVFLEVWRGRAGPAIRAFALSTIALAQLEVIFAIYMGARFGFTAFDTGMIMGIFGILMAGFQGGVASKIMKRWGNAAAIQRACLLGAFALAAFGLANQLWIASLGLGLLAVSRGILQPALATVASLGATENTRGVTMGYFHSGASLARVVGPVLAGWTYTHLSMQSPFFIGAGFLLLTIRAARSSKT